MNRFTGFKNFTQGLVFIAILIIIAAGSMFVVTSVVGNIMLGCQNKEIKVPDIEKAQFKVYVKATRKTYYTNHYELINGSIYQLHGYYEPRNGKYIYNPSNIFINPHYWGEIIITER